MCAINYWSSKMLSRWGFHTPLLLLRRSRRWEDDFFSADEIISSLKGWSSIGLTSWWSVVVVLVAVYFFVFWVWVGFFFFFFFSGGKEDAGIKKYMLPLLSSESGERIRIFLTIPWEHGLLNTWLGFSFKTSPAVIGRVISSTLPFKCTMRIKSRAPHGRTQAKQHLKLLPISLTSNNNNNNNLSLSFSF